MYTCLVNVPMTFSLIALVLPVLVNALSLSTYDLGLQGIGPTQSYASFGLTSPAVKITKWDDQCDSDGALIFIAPRGKSVTKPGPVILDVKGNLIWTETKYGEVFNLQVQSYRGEDYLTFWSGFTEAAHSNGSYYLVRSNYSPKCELDRV